MKMGETWEYFGSAFVNSCLQGHRLFHRKCARTILIYDSYLRVAMLKKEKQKIKKTKK